MQNSSQVIFKCLFGRSTKCRLHHWIRNRTVMSDETALVKSIFRKKGNYYTSLLCLIKCVVFSKLVKSVSGFNKLSTNTISV